MKTLEKKHLYKLRWDRLQIFWGSIFPLIFLSFQTASSVIWEERGSAENYILWSPKLCRHSRGVLFRVNCSFNISQFGIVSSGASRRPTAPVAGGVTCHGRSSAHCLVFLCEHKKFLLVAALAGPLPCSSSSSRNTPCAGGSGLRRQT